MKKPPDDIAKKLIDAADHFTGTGFSVSMDELAKATAVPRATLYYYFSGKDDVVAFFLNHKLDLAHDAIAKAAVGEGSPTERIGNIVRAVLHSMAEHPALCTELPGAMRNMANFAELALNAERTVMAPVREVIIEGKATGEFDVPDVETATVALQGAVSQVALSALLKDDQFDPDDLADKLVPLIQKGLTA